MVIDNAKTADIFCSCWMTCTIMCISLQFWMWCWIDIVFLSFSFSIVSSSLYKRFTNLAFCHFFKMSFFFVILQCFTLHWNDGAIWSWFLFLTEELYFTSIQKSTEAIVKTLKDLVNSPYAPEYDIAGITDPFLHIRMLKFLRVLGQGDADASDCMNDILAQVNFRQLQMQPI